MDRRDCVHRLQFNYQRVFNEQVDAVAEIELNSVVADGEAKLGFRAKACFLEFVLKTDLIAAFEKAGTESGMHTHRSSDDGATDLLSGKTLNRCCCHKIFTSKDTKVSRRIDLKLLDSTDRGVKSVTS